MKFSNPRHIHIEDYNYNLPDERIAKYPLDKRDTSKLLVYQSGEIKDSIFHSITDYLPQNSLMVFNNTKVIQARLVFQKATGARIEIFCLEPYSPKDYLSTFQQTERCSWLCLIGNAKKWKEGTLEMQLEVNGEHIKFEAEKENQKIGDAQIIRFSWDNEHITFADILDACGELPIPPYLHRDTEESDLKTYQTVYSKIKGSVAAPTAGLHFTPEVLSSIREKGIEQLEVTLHVGAGTFKPVKADDIGGHDMHSELISVKREIIEKLLAAKQNKQKVIAVGTTSVRTLESLYYLGVQLEEADTEKELFVSQWMPYDYDNTLSLEKALKNILSYLDTQHLDTIIAHTAIMIAPGYGYKMVDAIVTNFHQPQSTLLLLVSAFIGDGRWHTIYNHALASDYRFLSYGDSSLLLKE